ncbi:MAG: autotransporter-associated beta strand repeat-containing protein, partial [Methylacidiphilales bacterium]|nr:autotransporter-associated beta strand repeat-containing protein [Candidatus Methylacidiphilales bacterium]
MKFNSQPFKGLATAFAVTLWLLAVPTPSNAQFIYQENFNNSTAPGWIFYGGAQTATTSSPGPRLTSGATPFTTNNAAPDYQTNGDPEFGKTQIDSPGQGWLRLTTDVNNQANAAISAAAIPAAGATVTYKFDYTFWSGTNPAADGLTAFLANANVQFAPGAFGGSMGYAQKNTPTNINGIPAGYVGVGLDTWGNYSNPTEGRSDGPGFYANNADIRGAGSGSGTILPGTTTVSNYSYLGGTATLAQANGTTTNGISLVPGITATNSNLNFQSATTRPDQDAAQYRSAQVIIGADNSVTVQLQFGYSGSFITVATGTLSGTRPNDFVAGFTAGTGGATQVSEIRNFSMSVTGAGDCWTNYETSTASNNQWSALNTYSNWTNNGTSPNNVRPSTSDTVFFTDLFATNSPSMTINVSSTQTVGSMIFGGIDSYTVGTGSAQLLVMKAPAPVTTNQNAGAVAISRIEVLNTPTGAADQTIAASLQLGNNLEIDHFTGTGLTFSGNISMGANNINDFTDAGTTTFSGNIGGTGTYTKNGNGTSVLSGSNTYSGLTTVNNGVLIAANNLALGSTANGTIVNSSATQSGTLALANNITVANEALTLEGAGYNDLGALYNLSGTNTYTGNILIGADSTIAAAAGTTLNLTGNGATTLQTDGTGAYVLTLDPDTGAVINNTKRIRDNGGTTSLLKTGDGTAILGGTGTNTYTGATTVSAGILRATIATALGATGAGTTVNSGATLELAGNITLAAEPLTMTGAGVTNEASLWNQSGNNTYSGAITLTGGGGSVGAVSGSTLTISGIISGANQNLTVQGQSGGVVVLGGNNTYTGTTFLNGGTLLLGGSNHIASQSAVVLANTAGAIFNVNGMTDTIAGLSGGGAAGGNVSMVGGTLTFGGNNLSVNYDGVISGNGTLTKTGTGTETFTGSNTFTGSLNITQGAVAIGAGNIFANTMTLNLGSATLSTNGFSDSIGGFSKSGASVIDYQGTSGGILTFSSVLASTGTMSVNNWIGTPFTTSSASTTTGFFVTQGSITATMSTLAANTTFTGWGSPSGWKTVTGGFELVPDLSGLSRWKGPSNTWPTAGAWTGAVPNGVGAVAYFGDDPTTGAQTVSLSGTTTVATMILNGTGTHSYTFAASGGNQTLVFDQTGTTSSAYLTVAGSNANIIGSSSTSGQLVNIQMNDNLAIINNSTAATGLTLGVAGTSATLNTNGKILTFSGDSGTVVNDIITSTGSLVLNGLGSVLLNGADTYTGGTTLNNGALQIGNNAALGAGTFTISGGSVQAYGADRTITNSVAINNSFTVTGSQNLTLSGTQAVTISSNITLTTSSGAGLTFDTNKDLKGSGGLAKQGDGSLTFLS